MKDPQHLTIALYLDMTHSTAFTQQEWKQDAECLRLFREDPGSNNPLDWFPEGRSVPDYVMEACSVCPVRLECLVLAIYSGEEHGVWGGRMPHQIRTLRNRIKVGVRRQKHEVSLKNPRIR